LTRPNSAATKKPLSATSNKATTIKKRLFIF
jgi:hypothetical protein